MNVEDVIIQAATAFVRIGADLIEQRIDRAEAARALVSKALDLVPVDELRTYLNDEAARRAELAGDIAEAIKFGGSR